MKFYLNGDDVQLSREAAMRSHTWRRSGGRFRPIAPRVSPGPRQNDANRD